MRTTKELLIILRDSLENGGDRDLLEIAWDLEGLGVISYVEWANLRDVLKSSIELRFDFINKLINEL